MGWGIFYNDTVTLFNKCLDENTGEELWFPKVFEGVNLVETKGNHIKETGLENADSAKLYLMGKLLDSYVTQIEWEKLSEADKMIYYTFAPGKDFFVKGDKSDVLITDDFYQYMKENCDSVYKVTTVDHYSDVMKHMEVGGK